MAPKKKFYAIAKGRKPGIYTNWPDAQAQVTGFPGAVFKGFATRKEADDWIQNPPALNRKRTAPNGKSSSAKKPRTSQHAALPKDGEVTIYTDGGARYNPGPGGYGAVLLYDGKQKELSGGFNLTTNNRMELMGCIVALRNLKHQDKRVTLYSDSSYVVNGIKKGWAKSWRKKSWIKSDGNPALNADLWAQLLDLVEGLNITFEWVKGHAGNPMNELCDSLAVASARQTGLPEDTGYLK